MSNISSKYLIIFFICCVSYNIKAQDSLSLYSTVENQLDAFRILNNEYYQNPANMSDYGNTSFSNIRLNHQNSNKEKYLLQEGKTYNETNVQVSSYQAAKKNVTLWGNAAYSSRKTKNVQWNNNIDLERINPIVIADSIGGTMNLQAYNFAGGFAKNIKKFSFGTELRYRASLNYKTRDPRPKNTTSDLNITLGTAYNILNDYKIGIAAGINRYVQTTTIAFSSEVQRTALYQMNGMGTYNFYFSNKSDNAVFTEFNQNYFITFGSRDNLFNVTAGVLMGSLSKDISLSGNNSAYETNRIDLSKSFASVNKIFKIKSNYKIGGQINFSKTEKKGTDIFYTNNTEIVTKLLEKENYGFTDKKLDLNFIFQYQKEYVTIYLQPFYATAKKAESRYDIQAYQNFDYDFTGAKLFYIQQLNNRNILSLNTALYKRTLKNTPERLVLTQHTGINEWLINDYNLNKSNYKAVEAALRYDRKLLAKQSVYAIFAFDYYAFKNNKNIQTTISLGITF